MFQSIELIITLLLSSVIAVAVLKYFNISSTLAYLFVGLLLGPHAFKVLPDSGSIRPFLEFGIVFLMFTIGLEFSLPRLNSMRKIIFGLGGIQVIATILAVLIFSKLINLEFATAFVILFFWIICNCFCYFIELFATAFVILLNYLHWCK